MATPELEILAFTDSKSYEKWMESHFDTSLGIWMRLYNKASTQKTISHAEALDVALCFGWIDSAVQKYHDHSHLLKFSPRRPKGLWSKRNREHIERLIAAGRMRPSGLAQVESAKADGRWDAAYDAPSEMVIPEAFMKELAKNSKALAFFKTLNKANTYAIGWKIQTAKKEETKVRRINQIIEMLSRGEKFH